MWEQSQSVCANAPSHCRCTVHRNRSETRQRCAQLRNSWRIVLLGDVHVGASWVCAPSPPRCSALEFVRKVCNPQETTPYVCLLIVAILAPQGRGEDQFSLSH